ncbi:MAG: hypothetical protein GX410_03600 [Elusimicrobia bacterium]|nr:hypothetical protein [Elusimicrobiota bacterium]
MSFSRSIRKAVPRLGRFFPFRQLFKAYYRAALAACAGNCRACGSSSALFAHRGWTRGDWTPGISDLDLFLVLPDGANAECWARAYARLKGRFPMLGEWLCAGRGELELYLRDGDLRAAEFSAYAEPLCGNADVKRRYAPGPAKLRVDSWNECFHAHARLCGIFFAADSGQGGYGARKSLLDLHRYAACAEGGSDVLPSSRREAEDAVLGSGLGLLLAKTRLGRLSGGTALEAVVHSATILEREAGKALKGVGQAGAPAAKPELIRASEHECGANSRFCAELKSMLGPEFIGAVTDTLFESYFVFDFSNSAKAAESLRAFRVMAEKHPALAGAKIIVGRDSMRLLSACLRIEDPALCGFGSGESSVIVSGDSPVLQQHRRAAFLEACGGWAVETGLDGELRREAFAKMLISWRYDAYQGAAGEEKGLRLRHYWLPRAAHFHLFYAHGVKIPCYPAGPLFDALAKAVPEASAALRAEGGYRAVIGLIEKLNAASIAALK